MLVIANAPATFHDEMSWLNAIASWNIDWKYRASFDRIQCDMSWSNERAPLNIWSRLTADLMSQPDMFWLNATAP